MSESVQIQIPSNNIPLNNSGTATNQTIDLSSNPQAVRAWLAKTHPKQLSLLDRFERELRLGRLSTSSTAAARSSTRSNDPEINDEYYNRSRSGATGGGMESFHDADVTAGSTSSSAGNSSGIYRGIAGKDRRLVTSRTVELLRNLIGSTKWKDAAQLMNLLRGLGNELHTAGGFREPAIGNVVRRIMCAVRDEVASCEANDGKNESKGSRGTADESKSNMESINEHEAVAGGFSKSQSSSAGKRSGLSLASMLWAHPQHVSIKNPRSSSFDNTSRRAGRSVRSDSFSSADSDVHMTQQQHQQQQCKDDSQTCSSTSLFPPSFYVQRPHFRQTVMEIIQEIMGELEDLHRNIDDQATAHIHAGEIILTYGRSKTIESFLRMAAAKKRKFSVVVCEGAPHFGGHMMAKSLAKYGIDTTVINDAATFAIMARVNKVILPAHAVLANGGLIAPSGSNMVALAAAQNSVPVVCLTGMYKLCPMYPHEGQDTLQDLVSPSSIINYAAMSNPSLKQIEFVNPVHDYINPDLVNLYVTNIGAFQPSYIYRLLAEYYHYDDWESFE